MGTIPQNWRKFTNVVRSPTGNCVVSMGKRVGHVFTPIVQQQ
jgi:hypothetical protein